MDKSISYLLFLIWLSYLVVSSVLLFCKGFLLTRAVQSTNSTCLSYADIPCTFEKSSILSNSSISYNEQCSANEKISSVITDFNSASAVCLPPRAKVILLIVDALRYDFALYDEDLPNPLPYQNKLPTIHNLLNNHSQQSRLYKFIADPPTTTMQRLKGLTTGSLPTFIDAGSNFATSEINEDNIIDQLTRNSYNAVFMGDDTWNGLYPNRFKRNFPYPSFHVWDLDTVDNGVRDNLYPELNNSDWNLLIGHFLGVDHCGHRYGPNHREMERKLGEIDLVIKNVVDHINHHEDNTMLIVIGDHGMTVTGDHGGESEDEVTAGLFVYSKQPLLKFTQTDTVKQVDLVPTLAAILGVSIPFQNLGITIVDCLPISNNTASAENWQIASYYLWANVKQMIDYIQEYSENEKTFDQDLLTTFKQKFSVLNARIISIMSEKAFLDFHLEVTETLTNLRKMCEDVWVQFETFAMARGLLFLFLSIFFVYIITDGIPVNRLPEIFMSSFLLCSYSALFLSVLIALGVYYYGITDNMLSTIFFATGLGSQVMLGMLIIQNWEIISLNWYAKSQRERIPNLISRLVLIFNICGLFSNSYIIEESFVLLFLLITVILVGTIGITSISNKVAVGNPKRKTNVEKPLKWSKFKLFLLAIAVAALARASMYFWRCREEQQWCFASPHEVSFITMKSETSQIQWTVTVIFLTIFVFATKEWLKNCGNLNGYSINILAVKFLPSIIIVCMSGYWVLRRAPPSKQVNSFKSLNILAWTVYGSTILGILLCILKPLFTYIIPSMNYIQNDTDIIPKLFKKVKNSMESKSKDADDIPVICGLGTVYSSVYIITGIYFTLLFSLLLGDAVAPSAIIMFTTAAFILIVISVLRIEKANSIEELFDIPNISILVWIILSQYFFYGTGHQPTFPNIAWEAAFIGTSGVFSNNFIPGALIIINTYCSHILMGILLPLVLITPFLIFVMIPSVVGKKTELIAASARGEVILFERRNLMLSSMLILSCKYIGGHGIRVFASMLAATIHCRHLMVWRIFAPKLIFESIGIFVTIASVLVGYLILIRINKKLEGLIVTLNKMS